MFGPRLPSRVLNDSRFVLGLTLPDFVIVIASFVLFSRILNDSPYAPLSFIGAALVGGILLPIRLRHREHILRDLTVWILSRGRFK
jgi:hypothetical protein